MVRKGSREDRRLRGRFKKGERLILDEEVLNILSVRKSQYKYVPSHLLPQLILTTKLWGYTVQIQFFPF